MRRKAPPKGKYVAPSDRWDISKQLTGRVGRKSPAEKLVAEVVAKKTGSPMEKLFKRWSAGERIFELSSESGIKRSKLRRGFAQLAGGKDKFKALRATGAGGKVEAFGGKRKAGGSAAVVDGKDVERVKTMDTRYGWSCDWIKAARLGIPLVMKSPEGDEYVLAATTEKADLIHLLSKPKWEGLKPVRLKLLKNSRLVKKAEKSVEQLEAGEAAIRRARKKKREARKARRPRTRKRRTA